MHDNSYKIDLPNLILYIIVKYSSSSNNIDILIF